MKDTGIKFETLHKGFNFKKVFIGLVAIVAIGSVVILKGSKANYTYEEIIPFAEGEVHIKKYDFKIMAMYQQQTKNCTTDSCYKEITTMPESGYTINTTKSGCYKDSNKTSKNNNAKLYTNAAGEHVMSKLDKEDKCYVYFDQLPTARDKILADHTDVRTRAAETFKNTVTERTTGTIYESANADQYDDFGEVYYFAGAPTDNWVKFGQIKSGGTPIWWRIIRINGDGSIRMIYAGTGSTATTGTDTQITVDGKNTSAFNSSRDKNAYVGYMYGTPGASSYTEEHKNSTSSTIKKVIDNWYNTTTNLSELSTKLSHTAGFCGDRSSSTSSSGTPAKDGGYGTKVTYYGAYYRNYKNKTPSFKCTYKGNDLYTTPEDASQGNRKLSVPIGLITADEVAFAGGVYGINNKDFYLYTGQTYWTMSPSIFSSNSSVWVFLVNNIGWLNDNGVDNTYGMRPVINLKADVSFTGDGTTSSPYEVIGGS